MAQMRNELMGGPPTLWKMSVWSKYCYIYVYTVCYIIEVKCRVLPVLYCVCVWVGRVLPCHPTNSCFYPTRSSNQLLLLSNQVLLVLSVYRSLTLWQSQTVRCVLCIAVTCELFFSSNTHTLTFVRKVSKPTICNSELGEMVRCHVSSVSSVSSVLYFVFCPILTILFVISAKSCVSVACQCCLEPSEKRHFCFDQ